MRFGWPEIVLIPAIVIILFGVGKLPQMGSSLGRTIRDVRMESSARGRKEDKKSGL